MARSMRTRTSAPYLALALSFLRCLHVVVPRLMRPHRPRRSSPCLLGLEVVLVDCFPSVAVTVLATSVGDGEERRRIRYVDR